MAHRWSRWRRYVPVAERRRRAVEEIERLRGNGYIVSPVVGGGRRIAETFWGQAWCDNLERYSDFSNRLPRGRTYLRNGSVLDLQIAPGEVTALVSGSDLYTVTVDVTPVSRRRWRAICKDCGGAIDSLVELLQGRFSRGVMERICREKSGLFPAPKEIGLDCSCPDWAVMCKHVAAVLYGVGVRLDERPELLFHLRDVDPEELVAGAEKGVVLGAAVPTSDRVLAGEDLSELFGVEVAAAGEPDDREAVADRQAAALRSRQRGLAVELEEITGRIDRLYAEMALLVRDGFERG